MDGLFGVFLIQVILCILVFGLLYRLVGNNKDLEKKIESLEESQEKKRKDG